MQTKNQRNRNRQKQPENDEISNKKGAYENHINSLKLLSISVRQEQNKITVSYSSKLKYIHQYRCWTIIKTCQNLVFCSIYPQVP